VIGVRTHRNHHVGLRLRHKKPAFAKTCYVIICSGSKKHVPDTLRPAPRT